MKELRKAIVPKPRNEKVPECPFHLKSGARCVLVPEVREYERCGESACVVFNRISAVRGADADHIRMRLE